ncbi:hypothetical protein P3S67_002736 [Capsicum chacoense]
MGFGSSLLKGIHFGSKSRRTKVVESSINTPTIYVCRDELDKKKPKIKKQVKFDLEPKYHPSQQEEEINHEEENKKNNTFEKNTVTQRENTHANNDGVIKVKILMKKEDAARLLLKCRDGGALKFMDVAQQLVQVPSSNVRVVTRDDNRA